MISKVNEHFWLTKIAKHRKKWRQFFESVEIVPLIIKVKKLNKKTNKVVRLAKLTRAFGSPKLPRRGRNEDNSKRVWKLSHL